MAFLNFVDFTSGIPSHPPLQIRERCAGGGTRFTMFMQEVPGKIGRSQMSSASTHPVAHMSTAGVRREA